MIERVYIAFYHSFLKICLSNIFYCRVKSFTRNIHHTIYIEILRKLLIESEFSYLSYFFEYLENYLYFRQKLREEEDKVFETRRQMIQRRRNPQPPPFIYRFLPQALLLNRRSIMVTTAFSIVIGIFAYYYKTHNALNIDVIRWGLLYQPAQFYYRFLMK